MPQIKAEEQVFEVLPAADYTLIITAAENKLSKSKNDMIKVTFQVEGTKKKVFDYLVFKAGPCAAKITQFQRALGILVKEGDEIDIDAQDIVGSEVNAKLKIEKSEEFGDKNAVSFYYDKTKDVEPKDIKF